MLAKVKKYNGLFGMNHDGHALAVPPFVPRTHIISHLFIAEKPEGQITVRRTVAGLSVCRNFFFGSDSDGLEQLPELGGGLHLPLGSQMFKPLKPVRAGKGSSPLGADIGP